MILLASLLAHGPAPAILELLTLGVDGPCEAVPGGASPGLIRTNLGVHEAQADGTFAFGCPSRWGGSETALAAASPDGAGLWLAGTDGVYLSTTGGCQAQPYALGADDVPVAIASWRGEGWLLTRDFSEGAGSLWRLPLSGPSERVQTWTDVRPDGLLADGDTLWVAGSQPNPTLLSYDGRAWRDLTPAAWPPTEAPLDRLAPKLAADGGVWLLAGTGAPRALWWTDGDAVSVGPSATGSLLGPVRAPYVDVAVVDGALWWNLSGEWAPHGVEVDWTCLQMGPDGLPWACAQDELRQVVGVDVGGPMEVLAASLRQLGPPLDRCDDVDGQCDLDWLHFGGESGFVETSPTTCPDEVRTPLPPSPASACGCDARAPRSALGAWLALAVSWVRRRPHHARGR